VVPHRKILRAIALAANASLTPDDARIAMCGKFHVKFPRDFIAFMRDEILAYITPEAEAMLTTKDPSKLDYRPELMAAEELELGLLSITPKGLAVLVPELMLRLRKHDTLRICIETMILCGITTAQIAEDVRKMYGLSITEDDVVLFGDLFCDREFAEGDSWIEYTQCIGLEETRFKFQLMNAPKDYVRYALGAKVQLDSSEVLDRLLSDSYYTSQRLKIENPNPSRDEMTRIKMERDTMFKAMDRRIKIKEVDAATGEKGGNNAAALINNIIVKYGTPDVPMMDELNKGDAP
jgi:hypothetical protein